MSDAEEKPIKVEASVEKSTRPDGAQITSPQDNRVLTDQERAKQESFRSNDSLKSATDDPDLINRSLQITDGQQILVDSHYKRKSGSATGTDETSDGNSYFDGLKAIDKRGLNEDDRQKLAGQWSIEYIERKSEQHQQAVVNRFDSSTNVPSGNLDAIEIPSDAAGTFSALGPESDENTAQTWSDLKKIWQPVKESAENTIFPYRANPDKLVDRDAAELACNKFPKLSGLFRRHIQDVGPQLIMAIARNEANEYRVDKDGMPDHAVKFFGDIPGDLTMGPTQVKKSNQQRLAGKYAEILGDPKDYPKASEHPYFATLLIGALLDESIERFEQWERKAPADPDKLSRDQRLLYKFAFPSWQKGDYAEALIRAYNPGQGSEHVANVKKQLQIVRDQQSKSD